MATNLLTKVNLNGTELIISDTEARRNVESASSLATRVTNLESKTNSLVTATYDSNTTTLTLTSKS